MDRFIKIGPTTSVGADSRTCMKIINTKSNNRKASMKYFLIDLDKFYELTANKHCTAVSWTDSSWSSSKAMMTPSTCGM